MENKVYKTTIKKFLGWDVRVIQVDKRNEYIVCKDMFEVLGLVDTDGTWTRPKNKMIEFLDEITKSHDLKSLQVMIKEKDTKRKYVKREVICLNVETVPIILTQFKPTKRRGEQALKRWAEFMKFVDVLLQYHECHKYIINDKEKQKLAIKEIIDDGGSAIITNQKVNLIMGKLITDEDNFSIGKDELKIYQPRVTIDLLEVRNYVLDKFVTCYSITESHKEAFNLTLKLAKKKYLK